MGGAQAFGNFLTCDMLNSVATSRLTVSLIDERINR